MRATSMILTVAFVAGCPAKDDDPTGDTDPATTTGTAGTTAGPGTVGGESSMSATSSPSTTSSTTDPTTSTGDGSSSESGTDTEDEPDGPMVDLTDPQLYDFDFEPGDADPAVTLSLRTQQAQLDTRVQPQGRLVVYLHGAGTPDPCGSQAHGEVLAGMGFHVLQPCYESAYGVGNCGDDIGGCRLEAFEGVDHHGVIDIAPPDSIETRIVRGLEYLQGMHPGGDWQWYVVDGAPRWDRIVISGISHGASTSGVIGKNRVVERVVSLSGPLDSGQAWLTEPTMTPIEQFYGFTHTDDGQHPGHLDSFDAMGIPGAPTVVDGSTPPYDDSHRLVTSAASSNGHSGTQAGGASPMNGDEWAYVPVWRYMYGAD